MDITESTAKRRRFTWSKAARDLVRANLGVKGLAFSRLVTDLERLTGHPRDACLRFARSLGVKYKKPYRRWRPSDTQKLFEGSESNSRRQLGETLHRSPKAIELKQRRLGIASGLQGDGFTKYELASMLGIRRETVQSWIDAGWLDALEWGTPRLPRILIKGEDFVAFCKAHPGVFRTNRLDLTKERMKFLFSFVLAPPPSRLFKTREAKKEETAYQTQMANGQDWDEEDDFDSERNDPIPNAA